MKGTCHHPVMTCALKKYIHMCVALKNIYIHMMTCDTPCALKNIYIYMMTCDTPCALKIIHIYMMTCDTPCALKSIYIYMMTCDTHGHPAGYPQDARRCHEDNNYLQNIYILHICITIYTYIYIIYIYMGCLRRCHVCGVSL